jgi:GxxExxY protein
VRFESDNDITEAVIGAAVEVHKMVGPGLLESAYERCLAHELTLQGIQLEQQLEIPVAYKGVTISAAYRADLLVENRIIIELKAVDEISTAATAQVLRYLSCLNLDLGLIINFNKKKLVEGINRVKRKTHP